jgi:hypothetical protein
MANQQLGFEVVGKSNATEVMGKAGKEADKLRKKLANAFDFKGALAGAFIGAFGAAALLDRAINTITESFKTMADTADQAGKAGISSEEFTKLAFAAKVAGVDTRTLSLSIRELRIMMKDALNDTKKMTLLTQGLGFAEADVRAGNIKSIEVFQRVAQAIATQETDTQKLAIATAFFGDKVTSQMLPVLQEIGKNPDIFKGLLVATEETYKAADELDTKFQRLWSNVKTGVAIATLAIIDHVGKQKEVYFKFFSWLYKNSPTGYFGEKLGFSNPFEAAPETATASTAQTSKVNAEAIVDAQKKTVKNDNTIANSLGASMGNGPTSGVIGVGNNAQFTLMEEQLDTLKAIRESIDRLGTPQGINTDFTKQELPTV